MPQIRIEKTPIRDYGLGYFGASHLQLTYVADSAQSPAVQDGWFVIEGLRTNGSPTSGPILGVEGTDGRTTLSDANHGLTGSALQAAIGTPSSRNSTVLDFPVGTFEAWQIMSAFGDDIDNQFLPYVGYGLAGSAVPTINSSSVVASLLYYAGLDISQNLPFGLFNFTTGTETLIGSSGRDELSVTDNFTTLVAGRGSDILRGSDGTDKLYGGTEQDLFYWSKGIDFIHGGQPRLDYSRDGEDVVSFADVGDVLIEYNPYWTAHTTATYIATYLDGNAQLLSIERLQWGAASDNIILGKDVALHVDDLFFDLGGDGGGRGDKVSFSGSTDAVVINAAADGTISGVAENSAHGKGVFLLSAEWIEGTSSGDTIYANAGLRGIEGGGGDDLIDARLDAAFAGGSPAGYDIEIAGGDGNDTIVSGAGRSLAAGGTGDDRFVLSAVNTGGGMPELVIEDAEAGDRLYVPYNFFNGSGGGYEGSTLMPVLGALFPFDLLSDPEEEGRPLLFEWLTMDDLHFGSSAIEGLIDFQGSIQYTLDGSDLLIHLYQGTPEVQNIAEPDSPPIYYTQNVIDIEHETLVRVRDFEPGDLGIAFHDPGQPVPIETPLGGALAYPGWDAAVRAMTNNGEMLDPLPSRPTAPVYDPDGSSGLGDEVLTSGTEGDDVIVASAQSAITAGGGNDQITGSLADDTIDGGGGNDVMAGGGGDDTYVVDSAGDVVVEAARAGVDSVIASVDHTLAADVENLTLSGGAVTGTGNDLANRLVGNELANVLVGALGDDLLAGGGGDDMLIGGTGSDGYAVGGAEGTDTIVDTGDAGDLDTLQLAPELRPDVVTVARLASAPGDIVLSFAAGGRVVLKGIEASGSDGVDAVAFADGTVWSRTEILARADAAPPRINAAPQAADDVDLLVSGPAGVLPALALIGNDSDAENDAITIVGVSDASGGVVSLTANGDIAIATAAGYQGAVRFTYTISDGQGGTASARATVGVVTNADPIALGTLADLAASEDQLIDVALPVAIFSDPDGDLLSMSATMADGAPLPDWLTFDGISGRFNGTPPANENGLLRLTIWASDGIAVATHRVTLAIAPVNDAPVAVSDSGFATAAGVPIDLVGSALLANDSDPDGDTLSIRAVTTVTGGAAIVTADGGLRFTPGAAFAGTASVGYLVSDGNGGSATATVSIEVTGGPGQTFAGTSGNDALVGTAGSDTFTLVGDGGFDTIDGGAGVDTLLGSAFNDIVRLSSPASIVNVEIVDGGAGNDRILGGSGNDLIDASAFTLVSIETIDGGAGDDTITGSAGADTIAGNVGNDVLSGGAGDDVFTLAGDGGNDVIDGGAGFDVVRGSVYNDIVRIAAGVAGLSGIERIEGGDGTNDRILGSGAADVIDLTGIEVTGIETIDGGAGDDTITGSAGADTIAGNVGNDVLSGGAGDDVFTLAGDGGNDVIDGGAGFDVVRGSVYNDIVRIAAGVAGLSGIERIEGGDGTNDRILGSAAADVIDLTGIEVTGIETIDGGAGDDRLAGSLADDVLVGGAGNDVFDFTVTAGHDLVADFQPHTLFATGGDVIDLGGMGFASFEDVLAATSAVGADTVIDLDPASSVRLAGVGVSSLNAADFIL